MFGSSGKRLQKTDGDPEYTTAVSSWLAGDEIPLIHYFFPRQSNPDLEEKEDGACLTNTEIQTYLTHIIIMAKTISSIKLHPRHLSFYSE